MPFISQALSYKSISGEHNSKKIKTMAQAARVFHEEQMVAAKSRGRKLQRMKGIAIH
jgi:hypothetical protein